MGKKKREEREMGIERKRKGRRKGRKREEREKGTENVVVKIEIQTTSMKKIQVELQNVQMLN